MKSCPQKVCSYVIIATLVLCFSSFSFAQNENIKGVQFKDGSSIYGKIIKMDAVDIQIETKGGKIISRKFNDVDNLIKINESRAIRLKDGKIINGTIVEMDTNKVVIMTNDNKVVTKQLDDVALFIKADDTAEGQKWKKMFDIALGVEKMSGNTTYQIGYPVTSGGTTYSGYFPFSRLEWPLDAWLARIDANLNINKSWRINGVLKKNITKPGDNMKDSDWLTDSNPGQLDVYSDSDISKFDAWIIDFDVEWIFLQRQFLSLYTGLGWQYQKFIYDANLLHQYSPSGLPGYEYYGDGSVGIKYEINQSMPYLKLGASFKIKDKLTLDGSLAWSPLTTVKDEDSHLLRENGGKYATGDMDGHAYILILSAKYNFTPSWFLKGGFNYTKITVDGDQYQVYGDGTPIGIVKEESDSKQTSWFLTVGYTF